MVDTGVDHLTLYALFRRLSPRRRCRMDITDEHEYVSQDWPAVPPAVPYAVYLADRHHKFCLLCFDLDNEGVDAAVVAEDLARLCELLDVAGARYVAARSGQPGRFHVWASVPAGVPAEKTAQLARGLAAVLPSLDYGMLCNPATGCARPPGAVHRLGGHSQLDPDRHPDLATALAQLEAGNDPGVVDRLLAALPPAVRQSSERAVPAARRRPATTDKAGATMLVGNRRAISPTSAALLTTPPTAGGDYSAHLWRILLAAALACWPRHEIEQLLADPKLVGLEHLRSRPEPGTARRVARTALESEALLARQWERAVERARELPSRALPDDVDRDNDPQVAATTAVVAAIEAAAEAMPWRWATPGGPADREALRAACRIALACCTTTFALDTRRWSAMTGFAASTMALAAIRLRRPDPFLGPPWLACHRPAEGRLAAEWTLLSPDDIEQPTVSAGAEADLSDVDKGRTQGHSPRPGGGRGQLRALLEYRQTHAAHDVWTPRGGLGHHTARTHAALLAGARTPNELAAATGYTTRTSRTHLDRLADHGLAILSRTRRRARPGRRSLDRVARNLGVAGTGERRRQRHVVDRELLLWWEAEQQWRETSHDDKQPIPRGLRPGRHSSQLTLALVATGPLATYGRFPTRDGDQPGRAGGRRKPVARANGLADYTTAAAIVRERLAGTALPAGVTTELPAAA